MCPEQKARYEEDYLRRLNEYKKQMKAFSQNFVCKTVLKRKRKLLHTVLW